MSSQNSFIFIYGPPGSGKSSLGRRLAETLQRPFVDLDVRIEARAGISIAEIFETQGEARFRAWEKQLLAETLAQGEGQETVVALGGGALLDPNNRKQVAAHGPVLCLNAPLDTLIARLRRTAEERPLLAGDLESRLRALMAQREQHYASFPLRLETDALSLEAALWRAQTLLGVFRVTGMGAGYDVRVTAGGIDTLGAALVARGLRGPVALVSDSNVGPLYLERAKDSLQESGYQVLPFTLPAGEASKNLETVRALWDGFLDGSLERGSSVVALGGGVVSDLVGFAAATYMRGVSWVILPTSLLGMVDASLGGKTGIDLKRGKNLVGAFHPPRLVLADPHSLGTLPPEEFSSGMAEVVKHAVIADPELFRICAQGPEAVWEDLEPLIRRAMAVKIDVIQQDPYEGGRREALNLGHTVGHAVESVSGFRLKHGQAVALGMLVEARLAGRLELTGGDLVGRLASTLEKLGLPTRIPRDVPLEGIIPAMWVDKKRARGALRFSLPARIGEVRVGVELEDQDDLISVLRHSYEEVADDR
ncbi:MAG: 3-dehydroquinate synthase [Anaerolineales bacterium]|jgi:3-dehydroquinate synthase